MYRITLALALVFTMGLMAGCQQPAETASEAPAPGDEQVTQPAATEEVAPAEEATPDEMAEPAEESAEAAEEAMEEPALDVEVAEEREPAEPIEFESDIQKVSYVVGTQMATGLSRNDVDIDLGAFQEGLEQGLAGADAKFDQEKTQEVMQAYQEKMMEKMRQQHAPEGTDEEAGAEAAPEVAFTEQEIADVSYVMGHQIGSSFADQDVNLETPLFVRGMSDVMNDLAPLFDETESREVIMAFREKASEENKKASEEYLAQNKDQEGVVTTDTGLQYKIIEEGTGETPAATDTVQVHYRGTLADGTQFDSSYDRGEPATFPVTGVIPGWTEALQLMKVGDKWELFIPAELAYGTQGRPGIPPNSALHFEVELLDIVKPDQPAAAPAEEAAEAPAEAAAEEAPAMEEEPAAAEEAPAAEAPEEAPAESPAEGS